MDQAQVMKRKREDWTRLYHKTLKGLEMMIDMQIMVKDIKKMAEEANTMIMEVEGSVLTASINNRMMNAMNIAQISEDLQYLVQIDMDEQAFQVQRILANELDQYKERGNSYIDENIQKIQDLYMDEEQQGKVEEEEVILIKPYKVSESSSTKSSSFIDEEIDNLIKYLKFVKSPAQTRIF